MVTISEIRKKEGLSQKEFAKKYHINLRTLQNWEQGFRKTPDYVIFLINELLDSKQIKDRKGKK